MYMDNLPFKLYCENYAEHLNQAQTNHLLNLPHVLCQLLLMWELLVRFSIRPWFTKVMFYPSIRYLLTHRKGQI